MFMIKFCPFIAYKIIQNNVRPHTNTRENRIAYMGRKGMYSDVNVIGISEVYEVGVSAYFCLMAKVFTTGYSTQDMHLYCLVENYRIS